MGAGWTRIGSEAWRFSLLGWVYAFVANAHRVGGDLPTADAAFNRSDELWRLGAADRGSLDEVRLLDLKASLRRDQRRLDESLALLDQALAADKAGAAKGRLLIKRAKTLEEYGKYEEAVATLRSALPYVDGVREPRLLLVMRFNIVEVLQLLGQDSEVAELLPGVRALTVQLGNELDLVRLSWVEGRLAASLGRLEEAEAAFEQVRGELTARGIAYDAALVTLELAILYAEQGRTAEVQELSRQLVVLFQAQGVQRETLATWKLFCEAAARQAVTAELLRDLLAELRQSGKR